MSNDSSSVRLAGELRAVVAAAGTGNRLPSTRELARRFGVGPVTVQTAIGRLAAEGLIDTRPGAGNFAAQTRLAPVPDYSWQTTSLGPARAASEMSGTFSLDIGPDIISLAGGYASGELQPEKLVRSALISAARGEESMARPPVSGLPILRGLFARELNSFAPTGPGVRRDDVLITPGGQSALASIFRALGSPGDAVVMESPTYWGAITAARAAGLRIVPIARGTGAPDPEKLDAALGASGAKIFYAQPTFANPTGAVWSDRDAAEILRTARRHGAFVIEDDWARDLALDATAGRVPIAASDSTGHVIYVRSLTKGTSPALRVAAVIARGPALRRIQADRTIDDLYVSGTLQAAAASIMAHAGWRSHLRRNQAILRHRRDTLLAELASAAPELTVTAIPRGAFNLWLTLPEGSDARALAAACLSRGLAVSPGDEFFPAESPGGHLRLSFAGAAPERYARAAAILGEGLRAKAQ